MKKEAKIIIACISYFTRIPVWKITDLSSVDMKQTARYFPLMGWLVGGFSGLIYIYSSFILPKEIALLLAMASSLILTGAIHEDGFADFCDGFGGGYTKQRILEIMKDSSTGVFGALGLMMVLAIKFFSLLNIPEEIILPVFMIGHSISRMTSISFMFTHNYAREDSSSKSAVFIKKPGISEMLMILIFGVLPFVFLPGNYLPLALILIIPVYLIKILLGLYFNEKIGGYTGDLMGATQQICEIAFYLGILIISNYI